MLLTLESGDRRPIYQQIADEIRALIARGDLAEGSVLPAVRQLAADLGVNLNTVAVAYRVLRSEGLISVRHGAGTVVVSRTTPAVSDEELRRALRSALTKMVLAGLPRVRILAIVTDELHALMKATR